VDAHCLQLLDHAAYYTIQSVRASFDFISGYGPGKMNEGKWLTRIVFLETVAGVPGMVAGMIRHLHSLRLMRRDYGWIHTLLEEVRSLLCWSVQQPLVTRHVACTVDAAAAEPTGRNGSPALHPQA
jgi:hypothetical protein